MLEVDESLEQFRRDHSPRAYARLIETHQPLVHSVCRRYLRDPHDIEDAAQETFIRLAHHADTITGSITAWLIRTAHGCAIDLIRRSISERRRRDGLALTPSHHDEHRLLHAAIHQRLHDAMLSLDPASRQLIVARFFQKQPMRIMAAQRGASVATISRRTTAALQELADVLQHMGLHAVDDLTMAEHFGGQDHLEPLVDANGQGLQFARDWQIANPSGAGAASAQCLPGWTRPVRVGVFTSYLSIITPGFRGRRHRVEEQIRSAALIGHPGIHLFGIAEPGTTDRGPIEFALREYELTAGLIDARDAQALATLDVIMIGLNVAMDRNVAAAFLDAVQNAGVGLLNEYWTDFRGRLHIHEPLVCQMSLATPPIYGFHHEQGCGVPLPATVDQEHPLLPGLKPGHKLSMRGCGPVYRPLPGAQVLIHKDRVFTPQEHRIDGLGPLRMPAYLLGQLGRGRVVVDNSFRTPPLLDHLGKSPDQYMLRLLTWLAEPRRMLA